jgi:hypothetical protein
MWFAMSGLLLLMGLMMWVTVGAIVFAFWRAIPVPLVVGVLLWTAFRLRRHGHRRARFAAGTAPLPRRPAPPPRRDLAWAAARKRFTTLRGEYAAHECDPMAVLRLPALSDVSVPSTARFVDAFAEANALRTEEFPGSAYAERFVDAVERAEQAWTAAVEAAERTRDARFAPGERRLIGQVETLLEVAASSLYESERRTAYQQARRKLAELERRTGWRVPRPAALELEHRARGVLVAAP